MNAGERLTLRAGSRIANAQMVARAAAIILAATALGFAPAGVQAQETGRELYEINCSACHGAAGEGNAALQAPVLAGQSETYLARQMANFASGKRRADDNPTAAGMIFILEEMAQTDAQAIAKYLSSLAAPSIEQDRAAASFKGRGLYSGCTSCHGAKGQGNEALGAPRLSAQYGWYVEGQIKAFKNGARGFHADDVYGKQMKAMADTVRSDEDAALIVDYLATLEP